MVWLQIYVTNNLKMFWNCINWERQKETYVLQRNYKNNKFKKCFLLFSSKTARPVISYILKNGEDQWKAYFANSYVWVWIVVSYHEGKHEYK